jgi:hypothetical protein
MRSMERTVDDQNEKVPQMSDSDAMTDADEEEMVLRRLAAIRDLRQETHRLESEGDKALASGIVIPADWLHLLRRGLTSSIELAEEEHADGKLSDHECRERVKRARWLIGAIDDAQPDSVYSVAPNYQEALRVGLCRALLFQSAEQQRLTKYDPLGLRFIAERSELALGDLVWELCGLLMDEEDEP